MERSHNLVEVIQAPSVCYVVQMFLESSRRSGRVPQRRMSGLVSRPLDILAFLIGGRQKRQRVGFGSVVLVQKQLAGGVARFEISHITLGRALAITDVLLDPRQKIPVADFVFY